MTFLVDNQLPAALARFLRTKDADCFHVLDLDMAQASDAEICRYSEANNIVLISKDEDFLHLANRPGGSLRLVWIRVGNCRTRALLEALERTWPRILTCLEAGERVVEVR